MTELSFSLGTALRMRLLALPLLIALIASCGGEPTTDRADPALADHPSDEPAGFATTIVGADPPPIITGKPLQGLIELNMSGIGSAAMLASLDPVDPVDPVGSGPRSTKADASLRSLPAGLDFRRIATSTRDIGVRGNGGRRYVTSTFEVRNAIHCDTPGSCAAYGTARRNVTLIAISAPRSIGQSAISRLLRADSRAADPVIAASIMPSHGVNADASAALAGRESFQVFREGELPPPQSGASFVLPYGFVVNQKSGSGRTLAANPAPGQFDGLVTIAYSMPLQADPADDPVGINALFQFAEDDNTRVTQSLEERNPAGDKAAELRRVVLGASEVMALGCDRTPTIAANQLCRVRLSGSAEAPLSWIIDTDEPGMVPVAELTDEFDSSSLDRGKWCTRFVFGGLPGEEGRNQIQPGFADAFCQRLDQFGGGRGDVVNDEQHRYRDVDSQGNLLHVVSDGTLKLRAARTLPDPFPNPQWANFVNLPRNDGLVAYESAMISSKATFKPGAGVAYLIRARIRTPDVQGTFPQVWLYPEMTAAGSQWPPEIDIYEGALNRIEDNEFQFSQSARLYAPPGQTSGQTDSRKRERTYINNPLVNPFEPGFTGQLPGYEPVNDRWVSAISQKDRWIEVGARWDVNGVCFFVGEVTTVCENYRWVTNVGEPANPAVMILNLAVGGNFAGRHGIEADRFPTHAEVDWVRTWRITTP